MPIFRHRRGGGCSIPIVTNTRYGYKAQLLTSILHLTKRHFLGVFVTSGRPDLQSSCKCRTSVIFRFAFWICPYPWIRFHCLSNPSAKSGNETLARGENDLRQLSLLGEGSYLFPFFADFIFHQKPIFHYCKSFLWWIPDVVKSRNVVWLEVRHRIGNIEGIYPNLRN